MTVLRQRIVAVALNLAALGLLALHLVASRQPASAGAIPLPAEAESAWWGMWFMTMLPDWVVLVAATSVVMSVVVALFFALRPLPPATEAPEKSEGWIFVVAAGLLAAFVFFPIVHTRWGDAYLISTAIAWPDASLRLTHSWQAPLDVFLHSQVWLQWGEQILALPWRAIGGLSSDLPDGAVVYRLLSPIAGAIFLTGALGFAFARKLGAAWIPFLLLVSLGTLQLFFGYIENYSFAAAGVMVYLWLGVRVLHGRSSLWHAATALAITNALHPSTVVLAPSLLALGWLLWRWRNLLASADVYGEAQSAQLRRMAKERPAASFLRLAAQIVLPMLLVGGGLFVWMEASGHGLSALMETDRPGGDDARLFVPLWEVVSAREHYTMFAWEHLRDFLNEQALTGPILLPALAILWLGGMGARKKWRGEGLYLLTAALGYLLFIWVWNPDYGGQRDWDLFSLAAIPLAALTAWMGTRVLVHRRLLWAGLGALILLQSLHTAGWIWSNTLPWQWPQATADLRELCQTILILLN